MGLTSLRLMLTVVVLDMLRVVVFLAVVGGISLKALLLIWTLFML